MSYQTLESRRLLAANFEPASEGLGDYETDARLIEMFHGPVIPGRPIPPIQGVAPLVSETADDDFPAVSGDADSGPSGAAPFALTETFNLHSRPGSNFTIYLDFDGHTTIGTTWNVGYNMPVIVNPNYWGETGGGTNFSESRLELIQEIWQVVAEDFAAFDVNVTTQEPSDLKDLRYSGGQDTRWGTRAVMTKDTFASCGCGGHAYLGAFDDPQDEPAFVYNGGLNAGSETVSHEVGHQLGLLHDGVGATTYYSGHGSGATRWGPIMGAPFSKQITHWNNGDYFNASLTTEDDLSVITRSANFPYVPDDHANVSATATPLRESGSTSVEAFGIIERNDDVDWFRFSTGGGDVTLDIDVLNNKPNLDVWAGLYDSAGTFIVDSNPQTALSASLQNIALAAGDYFIKIDGVPRDGTYDPALDTVVEPSPAPYTVANPLGYSDYGSLGQFRISGSIIDQGVATVSIAATAATVTEGATAHFALTTSDGGSGDVTVEVRSVRQTAPGLPAPLSTEAADFGGPLTAIVSIVDGVGAFQIPVISDLQIEGSEFFEVRIVDAGAYAVADRVAGMEVEEFDVTFSIEETDAITNEGDPPIDSTHQFTINRIGPPVRADRVGWRHVYSGLTSADDQDFTSPVSGTILFDIGEMSQTLDVNIRGDIDLEPDENYSIELFVPDGELFFIDPTDNSAEGIINNDESIVSLASTAQYRLRQIDHENDDTDNWAFDNFVITGTVVDDDFDPQLDAQLWDHIDNGTPNTSFPGSDGNAMVFSGSGERSATTVAIAPAFGARAEFSIVFASSNVNGLDPTENGDDVVFEFTKNGFDWIEIQRFDESLSVNWTDVVVPLPAEATFIPLVIDEGNSGPNTKSIEISRAGFVDESASVNWSIQPGGTASVDVDDFVGGLPTGIATFAPGQRAATIEFVVSGDRIIEPDETLQTTIHSYTGAAIFSSVLTGTLINDDFFLAEINVRGSNGLPIFDGDLAPAIDDGTDFGLVDVDSDSRTRTFLIDNFGSVNLELSLVAITGAQGFDFSITQYPNPVIGPGESSTFEVAFDPTAAGRRNARIVIANSDADESTFTFAVSGLATDLRVEQVQVNAGTTSRSQLDSVKVFFNQLVEHESLSGAFEVRNVSTGQSIPSIKATPSDLNGRTEVLLTFENRNDFPVVLADGNYELRVRSNATMSFGANPYPMLNDYFYGTDGGAVDETDAFFRFYGDTDGDRDVDGQDYRAFGLTFLHSSTSPTFNKQLDADGDGDVDGQDYADFGRRFLKSLSI